MRLFLIFTSFVATVAFGCAPSVAQTVPAGAGMAQLAPVGPVTLCSRLASLDLSRAAGATVTITGTAEITGDQAYCRVNGTIARAIRFEVHLPLHGWTQRFLQTGCNGLCGMLSISAENAEGCSPVTDGSIVLASDDMGHQGMNSAWGENADQRVDFADRGNHLTTLAAKALITAFFGQAPRFSYFSGCSDGGREALIEAQRFPEDFDGIAAGAPALNFTVQNSFHHGWLAKVNTGADGSPLLTAVDMAPLHAAVLAACDGLDGLIDGQITDPRRCHFDPAVISCAGAYVAGKCLNTAQIAAVRAIYQGARSASGKRLEVGPLMPGSENEWIGVFVPRARNGQIGSAGMALGTINHLLFTPNPGYTIADFPFTEAEFAKEEPARQLYNAEDPDLSAFAARGGKLILYHGWADPHISPLGTIDYYERVGRRMSLGHSGLQRDRFMRLFLLPGMGHCGGGEGPSQFPLLASLMAWTEGGAAPAVMIAHRANPKSNARLGPPPGMGSAPSRPPAGAPPTGTGDGGPPPQILREMVLKMAELAKLGPRDRPVYAYPQIARYTGSGSVDDAANFTPVTPAPKDGISDWIGASR